MSAAATNNVHIAWPLPFARLDVQEDLCEDGADKSTPHEVPFVAFDSIEDEIECPSVKNRDQNIELRNEFDFEETTFMQMLSTLDAVSLAVYANVTRWACGLLGCSAEVGYQKDLDADIHIIRGYHSDVIIICVDPSNLLLSKNGSGALSLNYFQRVASYAVSRTIATTFIITNYADWTFASLEVGDRYENEVVLKCVALHSSSVRPSIRERIIAEACYYNPGQQELWVSLEKRRRVAREEERSQGSIEGRFPRVHGLAHLSVSGSRRKCEISQLEQAGKVNGVIDLLHDNIVLHTVSRLSERCRRVRINGTDLIEKLALSEQQLKHMLDIYKLLCPLQGTVVPFLYSIVVADPFQRGTHTRDVGVLMSDMGSVTLEDWLLHPIAGKLISQQLATQDAIIEHVAKAAFLALQSLHDLGVAHTNLPGHVVVDPEELTVSIVGLATAVNGAGEGLFRKDVRELRRVFLTNN